AANAKNIAVTPFRHDYVNLGDKIEAAISNQRIGDKPYFRVINRTDLSKIIDEQKRQNSGLMDESTAVEVGNLLGAQAIISGSVNVPSMHDDYYYVKRTKCRGRGKERRCWEVKVSCSKRTIALSAEIRMIDVSSGGIIYADNTSRQQQWDHCADDTRALPSKLAGTQQLANAMANTFAYKLTPHYRSISVSLLEDPDTKYSDQQKKLLENALLYIGQYRYDKAEELLRRLTESTASQSYVPFYNIGVIYEVRGNFLEAQHYYRAADELTLQPVEEINKAVIRIQHLIAKETLALQQIAR
ncbi:MAG: CsgG/HfaB family protein, partial [Thiovulaceae bacterium]|nr:CsgG/HfaB family protein [Sulfurimonadaceae bacterium]